MTTTNFAPPAPPRPLNPWWVRLPLLALFGALLSGVLLVGMGAAVLTLLDGRVAPGASVLGVPLDGLTQAEAAAALQRAFPDGPPQAARAVITVRHEDRVWQASAVGLGLRLDADATAAAAFAATHPANPFARALAVADAWLRGHTVRPVLVWQASAAQAFVDEISAALDVPPQDATLIVAPDGTVAATPARDGRLVDAAALRAALEARVLGVQGGEIPLVLHDVPARVQDAEAAAALMSVALGAPLTLVASDSDGTPLGPWVLDAATLRAALSVQAAAGDDGVVRYSVSADLAPLRPWLAGLADGLMRPAQDGRYRYDSATAQLVALAPAQLGRTLDVDATLAALQQAVFAEGGARSVQTVFATQTPRYHDNLDAAALGLTEVVSEVTTYFAGSTEARRRNIALSAERFNGVIIAPQEVFSFNTLVGDISREAGFDEGAIIFGGRTIQGVGGGVCQVSTTAFRAAFYGGFPITERHSHGYRVQYYEQGPEGPGMDAAIYVPTADFRFLNDTPHHLLIETETRLDQNEVTFRFISTNPGRRVERGQVVQRNVTPPLPTRYEANPVLQQGQVRYVDWSAEGMSVTTERLIFDLVGNLTAREELHTFYAPWAAIVQVAPGDPRLSS